uniref:Uncharacterized protein n=1 Tax=Alexandrium monilatum TaxID=311494 RepID=A0A7S4RLZ2_9DINO
MHWGWCGWHVDELGPLMPRNGRWLGFCPQPEALELGRHRMRRRFALVIGPLILVDLLISTDIGTSMIVAVGLVLQVCIALTDSPPRSRILLYVFLVAAGGRFFALAAGGSDPLLVIIAVPVVMGVQAATLGQVSFASIALLQLPQVAVLIVLWICLGSFQTAMSSSSSVVSVAMGVTVPICLHSIWWLRSPAARPLSSVLPVTFGQAAAAHEAEAAAEPSVAGVMLRTAVRAAWVAERTATRQDLFAMEMFCRHLWARPGPELVPTTALAVAEFLGSEHVPAVRRPQEERGEQRQQRPWVPEGSGRSVTGARQRFLRFITDSMRGFPGSPAQAAA